MSWDILPKGNLQYFLQKLKGKIGTPTELTTSQYNALPTSDKNDASKVYYLTDYPSGGGSSGGSGVSYGYENPTEAASDGEMYIYLDSTDKEKGKFLFITDSWQLISGHGDFDGHIYDNGFEYIPITVVDGTKNLYDISLRVASGNYVSYAITDQPIDLSSYDNLRVRCRYRDQDYDTTFDISSYTGEMYISFVYLTDSAHNEAAIGISERQAYATTFRIDSRNGGTLEEILYLLELS